MEWQPEGAPKEVLQISHGVTEHMLRYEELAEYFTRQGFVVVGNDHLGHGTSIAEGAKPMYFGSKESWHRVQEYIDTCLKLINAIIPIFHIYYWDCPSVPLLHVLS
ncbi:MAG: alpha/beta hydrolase [Lachnospiraceae bacterium]|nr:alpha/beta hydrolase [Lachnospiraceae bacterium]MBP3609036.1 alpha/beta hydrolase [Lachnospiraceae bacterium]